MIHKLTIPMHQMVMRGWEMVVDIDQHGWNTLGNECTSVLYTYWMGNCTNDRIEFDGGACSIEYNMKWRTTSGGIIPYHWMVHHLYHCIVFDIMYHGMILHLLPLHTRDGESSPYGIPVTCDVSLGHLISPSYHPIPPLPLHYPPLGNTPIFLLNHPLIP